MDGRDKPGHDDGFWISLLAAYFVSAAGVVAAAGALDAVS
jgi:hypothetical protein